MMSSDQELQLTNKLKEDGVDLENCTTTEKVLYVWKLYLASEDELKGVLQQFEICKRRHAAEVQEIETYVEEIKSLSDEREALTLEFEQENDLIKHEVAQEREEVADMFRQQSLEELASSSVPEQVAFLLVERAKLLDALDLERSVRQERILCNKQDNQTQTAFTQDQPKGNCDDHSVSEDLTNVSEQMENASTHSQSTSWQEECDNCRRLQKERNEFSTKFIVADEKVKSYERRVARYKVLLGEDAVQKEDLIADLQEELKECQEQLTEKTGELNSTTSELGQMQLMLSSLNDRCETSDQSFQPFDSTQGSLNMLQSGEQLAQQCQLKADELTSLQRQLTEVKENSSAELERVILDYEQKLEASYESVADAKDLQAKIKLLSQENSDLQSKLESIESVKERTSHLESERLEMKARIMSYEEETLAYQNELEQLLANQEEEMERNEQLQQQLQYASSTIEDLKGQLEGNDLSSEDELKKLNEQYTLLEDQHSELLEKLSSLTTLYEATVEKLNGTSTKHLQLKTDHQKVSTDYAALQQIHEILSDEVEQLMEEKETLSRTNSQLKQKMKVEEEFHAEELADGDQKLSTLTVEFSDLEISKTRLEDECEDLKARLENLQDQLKLLAEAEEEIEQLKSQVLELEKDNFQLAESVRCLTAQMDAKTEEVKTAAEEKENLREQLDKMSAELNQKSSDSEQGNRRSEKRYNKVIADYDRLNNHHQLLLAEHNDLDNKFNRLKQERKSLDEEYRDMQLDFDLLNEQLQTVQSSNEKIAQQNTELSMDCDRLREELTESQSAYETLKESQGKEQLSELEEEKAQWQVEMEDATNKTIDLTERIILLEKAANQLEGDNRELAKKLQDSLSTCSNNETSYNLELARLRGSNAELEEEVDRLRSHSETLERQLQSLQDLDEIASLKSEITRLNSAHTLLTDSLELRLRQSNSDSMVIKESYDSKSEELSVLQSKLQNVQAELEEEVYKNKQLENRCNILDSEASQNLKLLREANERRNIAESEMQQLAAELSEHLASKSDLLLHETDSNKAVELAESRIAALEQQKDELRASLQQVRSELKHANQTIKELSALKLQLQSKRDEIIFIQSKLNEEQMQRSYSDKKLEELKHSLSAANQRELSLQDQNSEVRQRLLDLDSKLSKIQSEKAHVQQELDSVEVKTLSATQKMRDLADEKETLELELLAANEKLQLQSQRYEERKIRHRSRIRNFRLMHDTEIAKLKDKMEYLDRDVTILKQALKREKDEKVEVENKCSTLTSNHRNLLSRQVDLEDEIRECNRGIALLQTKLRYTEQDNKQLTELCSRLKSQPLHRTDLLDSIDSELALKGTFSTLKESMALMDR
ncbi:myosin heavy chain, cardiac muscle isoform-like isoform X2 [Watersipora subatra]|uniref:myosin heavy chain, cardiac muscle isoform-like isoform X2 n=1 Tax=Watersipora subatra TaxID=2589382 RepID=UPI00355C7F4D